MGDPLCIKEVVDFLGRPRLAIYKEVKLGRLPVRFVFCNELLFDSDDVEEYKRKYCGNNWMNEAEIGRYLGIAHGSVIQAFHGYENAGLRMTPTNFFSRILYDIDSEVFKKVLEIHGWDKYAKPDGHRKGKSFSSEHERREYARSGRRNQSAQKRK